MVSCHMNKHITLLIAVVLGTIICAGQSLQFSQKDYTIPVVKEKCFVALIRIDVSNIIPGGEYFLQQLSIELTGAENINTLKVYHSLDSLYLTEDRASKAALFGLFPIIKNEKNKYILKGNLRLNKEPGFIWIGADANKSAKVGAYVEIAVSDIMINQQIISASAPVFKKYRIAGAVRQSMQDNVHTSRIPGIATAINGDLLAIYDARYNSKRDLQGDIDIALNRSSDKGNTWYPLQTVIDMKQWGGLPEKFNGVSDPCITVDKRTGTVFVAALWMHGVLDDKGKWIEGVADTSTAWNHQWKDRGSQPGFDPKRTAQFLIVKSTDNGKTWSEPVNLTRMCKKEEWWLWAPAPGNGITAQDGTLIMPAQGRDKTGKAFSTITYSKDGGRNWMTGNPAYHLSTTECTVVQLSDGSVMLNMRTNANKEFTGEGNGRAVAITHDLGKTWSVHKTSRKALPEPVCMASLFKHEYIDAGGNKKSVLLFVNPNSTSRRQNITLKVSDDEGNTWPESRYILLDELNSSGYSCITSVDNDTIGIIYEGSQAQLVFEKIKLSEILK